MLTGKLVSMYTPSPGLAVLVFMPLLSCISSFCPAGTVSVFTGAGSFVGFCANPRDVQSRREEIRPRMLSHLGKQGPLPAHHTTFCSLPYTHLALLTRSRTGSCARNLLCESLRGPCFHDEFSDASDQHLGAIVIVPALVLIVIGESRNNN